MYIDKINIKSFGPIEKLSLKFNPKGINVVFGDNGTLGTSQITGDTLTATWYNPNNNLRGTSTGVRE